MSNNTTGTIIVGMVLCSILALVSIIDGCQTPVGKSFCTRRGQFMAECRALDAGEMLTICKLCDAGQVHAPCFACITEKP